MSELTTIWIDPGGVTGWSRFSVLQSAMGYVSTGVPEVASWEQGQFEGTENEICLQIMELLFAWPDAAVGIEDFVLRRFSPDKELLSPVRITAIVEHLYWRNLLGVSGGREMFKQQPAMAMSVATDARLKNWGFYDRKSGPHARDATRHSLTFLRRCASPSDGDKLRAQAWPRVFGDTKR